MTDALHDFAVEVTCEPSLNNLMDSLLHDFSSAAFYITFTNIWQRSNLKNIITLQKLNNNEHKNSTCSIFLVGS